MTGREEFVYQVFQKIADGYDRANRRISLGADLRWKKSAAVLLCESLPVRPEVLDIGCGTGDMLRILSGLRPDARLTGLDFSLNMLEAAKENCGAIPNLCLLQGNAMRLPFENDSFDGISISFALRNMADYGQVLREAVRVLRPGGKLAVIDSFVPQTKVVQPFYRLYFSGIMPILGGGLRRHREYRWLSRSTKEFITADELCAMMERAGLRALQRRSFMFGACVCAAGIKYNSRAR